MKHILDSVDTEISVGGMPHMVRCAQTAFRNRKTECIVYAAM